MLKDVDVPHSFSLKLDFYLIFTFSSAILHMILTFHGRRFTFLMPNFGHWKAEKEWIMMIEEPNMSNRLVDVLDDLLYDHRAHWIHSVEKLNKNRKRSRSRGGSKEIIIQWHFTRAVKVNVDWRATSSFPNCQHFSPFTVERENVWTHREWKMGKKWESVCVCVGLNCCILWCFSFAFSTYVFFWIKNKYEIDLFVVIACAHSHIYILYHVVCELWTHTYLHLFLSLFPSRFNKSWC